MRPSPFTSTFLAKLESLNFEKYSPIPNRDTDQQPIRPESVFLCWQGAPPHHRRSHRDHGPTLCRCTANDLQARHPCWTNFRHSRCYFVYCTPQDDWGNYILVSSPRWANCECGWKCHPTLRLQVAGVHVGRYLVERNLLDCNWLSLQMVINVCVVCWCVIIDLINCFGFDRDVSNYNLLYKRRVTILSFDCQKVSSQKLRNGGLRNKCFFITLNVHVLMS